MDTCQLKINTSVKFSLGELEVYKKNKPQSREVPEEMTTVHIMIESQPLDKDKKIVRNGAAPRNFFGWAIFCYF
jgi:hypothetical protein